MPTRPHAHLMLPSPLGLLEYDVLEDGVFLGPPAKGGLQAGPTPFKGACIALTRTDEGFVARPLPGEEKPQINGEAVDERPLVDGDRIRIGDQVVLFRTNRGPLQTPAPGPPPAPAASAGPRPSSPALRRPPPPRRNPAVAVVALVGLALLLAATYRAVNHLKAIQSARLTKAELPAIPKRTATDASRASRDLEEIFELERRNPNRQDNLVARYTAFERAYPDLPEACVAHDRAREIMVAWSVQAREDLDRQVETLLGAHQFSRALQEIRAFESRFAATPAAEGVTALRQRVRAEARTALDALISKAGPLITTQPRAAHRMLLGVGHEFPADMAVEAVALLERAVARMVALNADRQKHTPGGRRPRPGGGELPPIPRDPQPERPEEPADPGPPPREGPTPAGDPSERMARDAWAAALAELRDGKYPQALQSYTMLVTQHGNTACYRAHKKKIAAGRYAAKVGSLGPMGLLSAPAQMKRGRLEVEYQFNDQRVFEEDWTQEQPFSSEMPVQVRWSRGSILMEKASGVFHKLVFLPDVRLEAMVSVMQPHDFGLMALQESDDFRAVLFDVANTKFTLKKGADARANPGHVLWYIGQGVWSAADKDAHGYIKIAERSRVKLESGDRLKMEFVRNKATCEASFEGKTDGVHLEGMVKGDDGSTMGSARVGFFTNSGIITVDSALISGVVDPEWFRKQLEFLVSADPGPDSADDGG